MQRATGAIPAQEATLLQTMSRKVHEGVPQETKTSRSSMRHANGMTYISIAMFAIIYWFSFYQTGDLMASLWIIAGLLFIYWMGYLTSEVDNDIKKIQSRKKLELDDEIAEQLQQFYRPSI